MGGQRMAGGQPGRGDGLGNQRRLAAEQVRGSEQRFWDDVVVGEPVQPIVRGPLTVADMIAWMMGVGSPHIRSGQYWLAYRRQSPKVVGRLGLPGNNDVYHRGRVLHGAFQGVGQFACVLDPFTVSTETAAEQVVAAAGEFDANEVVAF